MNKKFNTIKETLEYTQENTNVEFVYCKESNIGFPTIEEYIENYLEEEVNDNIYIIFGDAVWRMDSKGKFLEVKELNLYTPEKLPPLYDSISDILEFAKENGYSHYEGEEGKLEPIDNLVDEEENTVYTIFKDSIWSLDNDYLLDKHLVSLFTGQQVSEIGTSLY